jgi:hypothetical protein
MVSAGWRRARRRRRRADATDQLLSRIISELVGPNESAMRLHKSARARISSGGIPVVLEETIAPLP